MLNHIVMMGRLVRDPELRKARDTSVCSFRIACDRDYKNKDGERDTDFVDVVVWRQLAETVAKFFSKGRMAVVSGRLQIRNWTDNSGNKRSTAEVVADNVYFGDSKRDNEGGSYSGGNSYAGGSSYGNGGNSYRSYNDSNSAPAAGSSYAAPAAPAASDFAMLEDDDSELPF